MQSFHRFPSGLRSTLCAFGLLVSVAAATAQSAPYAVGSEYTPATEQTLLDPAPSGADVTEAAAPVASSASDIPVERATGGALDRLAEALGAPHMARAVDGLRVLQRGVASWYGRKFHGRRTASGERYDMYAMTAAHPSLPMSSYIRVRNVRNDRSIVVRVNDRGPFHAGRIVDLSFSAARELGLLGTAAVEIERISEAEIRSANSRRRAPLATALPAALATAGPALALEPSSNLLPAVFAAR